MRWGPFLEHQKLFKAVSSLSKVSGMSPREDINCFLELDAEDLTQNTTRSIYQG
jgi:hypothetical protein